MIFTTKKISTPIIHIIAWSLIFLLPLFFLGHNDDNVLFHYSRYLIIPISMVIIFYVNYFTLIDKYLFKDNLKKFITYNIITITLLCCGAYGWQENLIFHTNLNKEPVENVEPAPKEKGNEQFKPKEFEIKPPKEGNNKPVQRKNRRFKWWHAITNLFSLICVSALAIAIKAINNWYEAEEGRKELEKNNIETELKNLKSQLNPHFLFNTLNNIYALIAISQEKSQEAIMELSKMLRYVLYEDNQRTVPIVKEIDFINNYVKLMKLRILPNVEVTVDIDISQNDNIQVAPLLFISLIENAFKHGIANNQPSFIHFSIKIENTNCIHCQLENSYFPKTAEHDKSGSGIGLENLKRRLELLYPNKHTFSSCILQDTYKSDLFIDTSNN